MANEFHVTMVEDKKIAFPVIIFRTFICILIALTVIVPLYFLLINATRSTSDIMNGVKFIPGLEFFNNLKAVFEGSGNTSTISFGRAFINSVIVTVPTTLLQIYFGSLTAYAIHIYKFKHKNLAWTFIFVVMMVPTQVSIVGLIRICNMTHMYGTFLPLILPAIASANTVYFMKQYMANSLSVEIVESARIDGAKELYTFNHIVLPILKPALATQAILAFVASWNSLYTPSLLLATESSRLGTVPMFIEALKSNDKERDFGQIYCGLFITLLPILFVYFTLSKKIIDGVALGSVKE